MPIRASVFLLILPGLAFSVLGAEPAVVARWGYLPSDLVNNRLATTVGALTGPLTGASRLQAKPNRIELTGSHIRLGDIASTPLPHEAITVETWVRVDKTQPWCGFVSAIQDNGTFERGWMLGFKGDRLCFGLVSEQTKRITYLTDTRPLLTGVWQHVAGVYDGNSMKLYVDGELAAQSTAQRGRIIYASKGPVALGAYVDDNEKYSLQGALANTAIHNGPLHAAAFAKRFAAGRQTFSIENREPPKIVGWPTYMHDDARSGATEEQLALPLNLHWVYRATHPPEPAWPPPAKQNFWANKFDLPARVTFDRAFHVVSDGQRVYFGSSADDQVRALDLINGEPIWSHFSEGPVRLAPTVADGQVYFGSDDGRVYCLDAETGDRVWRFDAAPKVDRIIPGNGRLISTHPVRTGVIVHNGTVRFGSGLFPSQGAYQFAVDAKTGKQLAKGELGFSPQGYLALKGGALQIAQGRAPATTFAQLPASRRERRPAQTANRKEYAFASIRSGQFLIGGGDGTVAVFANDAQEPIWTAKVEGKAYSLAIAGGRLLVSTDKGVIYCFGEGKRKAAEITEIHETYLWRDEAERREFENWGSSILQHADATAGYCLLVGGDVRHAHALSQSRLHVLAVSSDEQAAEEMRRFLDASGRYGSAAVSVVEEFKFPFASKLFNLVVLADGANRWDPGEFARVVRPSGGVLVDSTLPRPDRRNQRIATWKNQSTPLEVIEPKEQANELPMARNLITLRRPQLQGAGEWTHLYGNPANTSCSGDAVVEGELDIQWFGRPGPRGMVDRHHRATAPLSVDGRLFVPGNEQVYGVDAYNGAVLWHVEMPGFRRVGAPRDGGNMTATADTLYVVAKDTCYALASKDGSTRATFTPPKTKDGPPRHWGLAACLGDALYGSTTQPEASRSGHDRKQINETYYDFVAIVTSDSVFELDRHTGKLHWQYQAKGAILNPTITIGGDRIYFVESRNPDTLDANLKGRVKLTTFTKQGSDLVALDRRTGKEIWRRQPDFSKIQHHLYLAYAKEKLVAVGTRNQRHESRTTLRYDLAVFDAVNGEAIWTATQDQGRGPGGSHGEQDQHPTIVGDTILQEPYAYDLATGARRDNWRFNRGGHGCGAISASASAFFFRAGNPTMCDVASGKKTKVNAVSRPGCWINIIPAGGMLLIPEASSGCTCNFPVQGSMAFAPREK